MTRHEATFADWLDWLNARGVTHPLPRDRVILRQIGAGRSWVWREAAAPARAQRGSAGVSDTALPPPLLALGGILHAGDLSELWFEPGAGAARRMPALVLAFRTMCRHEAATTGRVIVARVRRDNRAGRRLVNALGFREVISTEPGITWWEMAP